MKIKYTPNDFLLKKTSPMYERLFINQEYTVYGILIIENITYFYICESTDDDYSNVEPITRSSDQTENIRIVIKY